MLWDEFKEGDIVEYKGLHVFKTFFWIRRKFKSAERALVVELIKWNKNSRFHIHKIKSYWGKNWFNEEWRHKQYTTSSRKELFDEIFKS